MPHEEIQPLFLEFSGFVPGFQCKHGFSPSRVSVSPK